MITTRVVSSEIVRYTIPCTILYILLPRTHLFWIICNMRSLSFHVRWTTLCSRQASTHNNFDKLDILYARRGSRY